MSDTQVTSFDDILDFANEQVTGLLADEDQFTFIRPEDCGLDNRTAYNVWIGDEGIVIRKSDLRTANYYGGFEYVDKEDIVAVGDYILYTINSDRIECHVDNWKCSLVDDEVDTSELEAKFDSAE
jgi:hypothetical protein